MNYVEEYKKHIEHSRTQKPIGFIEYKTRPITKNAERAFSEKIKQVVEKSTTSFVRRILSAFEIETNKKYLSEENYKKTGFDNRFELHYWDGTDAEITIIRETILRNTAASLFLIREEEIDLTLGEFIPYPPVKELTFDDIPDLRLTSKGGE